MPRIGKIGLLTLAGLAFSQAGLAETPFEAGVAAYGRGDYAQARSQWEQALTAGDWEAARNLGLLYRKGLGIEANPAKAADYYKQAADHGIVNAELNLAEMYLSGQGVPKDTAKARELLEDASSKGSLPARYRLDEMHDAESRGGQPLALTAPKSGASTGASAQPEPSFTVPPPVAVKIEPPKPVAAPVAAPAPVAAKPAPKPAAPAKPVAPPPAAPVVAAAKPAPAPVPAPAQAPVAQPVPQPTPQPTQAQTAAAEPPPTADDAPPPPMPAPAPTPAPAPEKAAEPEKAPEPAPPPAPPQPAPPEPPTQTELSTPPTAELASLEQDQARAHVASYRSESDAARGWLAFNLPGLLPELDGVDIPGKGHFVRLYAVGPSDLVQQLCDQIKARGEWCRVVKTPK